MVGGAIAHSALGRLNVVIVGAGIGGLTAAIGLRQDGHQVVVLDQAAQFGEVCSQYRLGDCYTI